MAVYNQISWISLLQAFYGCVTIEHNPPWEGMLIMLMVILLSGQVGLGKDLTQKQKEGFVAFGVFPSGSTAFGTAQVVIMAG